MKTAVLFLISVFLFVSFAKAEGLILLDAQDGNVITGDTLVIEGDASTSMIKREVFFKNTTEEDVQVILEKAEVEILPGTNNTFCWDDFCYTPDVYEVDDPITLAAGETSSETDFYVEYYPGGEEGTSIIDYLFSSRNDGFEPVKVTLVFETSHHVSAGPDPEQYFLSEPYPNPASSVTRIAYDFPHEPAAMRIRMFNSNGQLIDELVPEATSRHLVLDVSDYQPGMYFYTLIARGQQVSRNKLVVQPR